MSRRTQKNVGVIGLGIIGSRVADSLRRRGFHVFVWNRTPRPFPNFVGSRGEVAEICDFIQIFVSDDDALLETVEQLKRSLKPHHVVMAHSTVAPHTMRAAAEIVQRRGAQFLDAPFTGSKNPAERGELVYYVAGDDTALKRARPVLEASSKEIVEIGEVGQATTVKIATNMITAATVQAAAEALALVHSSGLSVDKFAAAMRGNAITSPTLALKLPKMMSGDFEPHFSVKHMLKDVQIASRLGQSYGLSLGAMEAARISLRSEAEEGRGDFDFSSLVRVFFPDGTPSEQVKPNGSAEEQQMLGGLGEPAAVAEKPEVVEQAPTAADAPKAVEEPPAKQAIAEPAQTAEADAPSKELPVSHKDDSTTEAAIPAETEVGEAGVAGKESHPQVPVLEESVAIDPKVEAAAASQPETDAEPGASAPNEAEPPELAAVESTSASEDDKLPQPNEALEARRSLFSRMFGKAGDY